ncbi:MutS-related protein [Butyrivibrio sp. FCS014]|uniref:MutS-related protein n=1 Tax=Butyrivibrio sp. FCS014 TaxID=1408304 RepID=UPI000466232A|nr:DNA mismatch repair protein [Butyrivibrio sp. FCS014]
MKYSLLFPNQNLEYRKTSDLTVHDIGMDSVLLKLSEEKNEQTYITNVMKMITADPENARFRSDVFDDIYRNKKMREELLELLDKVDFLKEYGSYKHDNDHDPGVWDLLHRLEEINDYIESIGAIYRCLAEADIHSKGLLGLKKYVSDLYEDNGFEGLKKDIKNLRADTGNLKSVTVGINLNERFEASGIGLISINNKPFTRAKLVSHFMDKVSGKDIINDGTEWKGDYKFDEINAKGPLNDGKDFIPPVFSPLAMMSVMKVSEADDTTRTITNYMDKITDRMLSQTVKHLRNVLNKYTMLTVTDITDLMPEFIFYIRWAEYIEKMTEKGAAFCKPLAKDPSESEGSFSMESEGVYNIKLLAEHSGDAIGDIVTNRLDFSDEHTLYILTGANMGGKTTITQTIGQLFFIAQAGIYVPATKFEYVPVDDIFTHFPADEDKTMDLGRLGEECKRFKEIYELASEKSLMLLNETFSTTSFEEGYYIARDCSRAILRKGIRTIYNTHMHKLAMEIDSINDKEYKAKAASLVVKAEEGRRLYEVEVAPPKGLSYARDIAEKYGVTFEMLTK